MRKIKVAALFAMATAASLGTDAFLPNAMGSGGGAVKRAPIQVVSDFLLQPGALPPIEDAVAAIKTLGAAGELPELSAPLTDFLAGINPAQTPALPREQVEKAIASRLNYPDLDRLLVLGSPRLPEVRNSFPDEISLVRGVVRALTRSIADGSQNDQRAATASVRLTSANQRIETALARIQAGGLGPDFAGPGSSQRP